MNTQTVHVISLIFLPTTTTGNIRDATNIMDASSSKEATAGTPVKAV
jgi:hypothetical protein